MSSLSPLEMPDNSYLGYCQLFVVAHPSSSLPFQVEHLSRPAQLTHANVGDQTRYNNRVLDLRVSSRMCLKGPLY